MSAHPNVAKLDALMACFAQGDLEGILDHYAEDGVYRVAGDNIVSGNYRGRDAIRDFFIHLNEVTGGSMRLTVEDALADDDHAVMFWHLTTEREGRSLDASGAMAFKIDADGKFSESWFLYDDQRAYDAFYS
jgi:ketosteroid isomerase-like protein